MWYDVLQEARTGYEGFHMHVFKDYYHNTVKLSFEEKPFSSHPKHVWAICR
ncbi:nucleoside triphosphatase YtkD, partial [Bacillus sp. JR_15]